jgi:hypothetical protein
LQLVFSNVGKPRKIWIIKFIESGMVHGPAEQDNNNLQEGPVKH